MTNERNDRMFRLSELERRMISYGHVPSADLKEVENDVTEARKRLDLKEDNLYLSEAAKVLKNPGLAVETYESEDFAGRGDQAYENLHEFWCLTWFKHDITISAKMEITSFLAHLTKENEVEDVDRLLFYIEKMDENLPDLTEEFKQFFFIDLYLLSPEVSEFKDVDIVFTSQVKPV
ncbi:uncharacterized protein LOC111715539 [Eurytemora carolleeae]|uniref:uncharacterized protein LOC111715539 n=1 Tax=Eurytemora carolleeae TaxID=1294199 RepID=UPI000C77A473|nr:uncharacterized protein LOC111715539 [Eurytemora carolleeae]|eukprot:XP_023346651.1 uncharacterized protein LOC111715539 [Eurytemora affinis]